MNFRDGEDIISLERISPAIPGLWISLQQIGLDKIGRLKASKVQADDLGRMLRKWIGIHTGKQMKSWHLISELGV